MKNNHKTIFLQFLETYKQLTFFELSILTEFFKKRLLEFNGDNEVLAKKDLKPDAIGAESSFPVPSPTSIAKIENGKPILHLTDHAKVNFSFVFDFCNLVISGVTLRTIQKELKINYRTAMFRRYKVFIALRDYMSKLTLKDTVYFDEILVQVNRLTKNKRQKWHDTKSKPLTGKVVVAIACDKFGTVVCKDFGETSDTIDKYACYYGTCIEKKSTVIADSHAGLSKLIKEKELYDNRVKADTNDPMALSMLQPINSLSSSAVRFIEQKHHGIAKENIQDYLNLFSFKQTLIKHNFYHNQMVIFLVELIYSSPQELTFRDLFPRKK